MQKMMMFVFPPMIAVTTYIFPVGLWLYMIVSTLFVIVQQQIVQTRK
jgi:membrane protein insertase Oxa1/YidC/SpoIIIJ